MSDEVKPRSLREISARAKDAAARPSIPPPSTQDLLSLVPTRPSAPPGSPGERPSAPPGSLPGRASSPPGALPPLSRPPGSLPPLSRTPVSALPPPPGPVSALPPPRDPNASGDRPSASALASPPAGRDSGKIDLAALSASARVSEPAPSSLSSTTRSTEASATASAARPSTKPAAAESKGSGGLIAGVIGVLALIGVGVVVTRSPAPPANAPAKVTPSAAPVITAEPAPTVKAAESVAPAAQPPSDPAAFDINALSGATPEASGKPGLRVGGPLPKATESAAPVAAPVVSAPVVASAAPVPMGSVGALMDEMRKRVGADGKPVEETAQGPSGPAAKQDKPSQGAVLGAIGAVRGAVKGCLDGIEAVTRVGLVFGSDGSVKSVSVSGGAAGKSAEACVKAAAMKARVAPFNDDSFSTSFSVRP